MSKLNWPLATVLLIIPLVASCGRPSSEQGPARIESPKAATGGVALADLVAMVRQVRHLHRMQQLQALRQQEQQLLAVAFPLPEKHEPNIRPMLDEKTAAEEPAEGEDDQQPPEPMDAEAEVTESPSDAEAPPGPSLLLDRLALSRTVLQAPVHRLRCRIASLRNEVGQCLARFPLRERLSERGRLRSDSSRRVLDRCSMKSTRRPVCRFRSRRR